jgi:hypothetical protein
MALFLSASKIVELAAGHASMIMPPSRNSIDSETDAWSHGKHPKSGTIQPYDCHCTNGTDAECNSGQSCLWFSQGCTIGCKACDGKGARIPKWDHCPLDSIKPTLNDPKYRSLNQNATAGSVEDIFFFNPWRAPGRAPVFDPCGKAGGSDHQAFNAGEYNTTVFAKQGDLGSAVLKPRPSGTVWQRGTTAKTRWQYTASHGGGYQYRLCKADRPLTEECFQASPLAYARAYNNGYGHGVLFANGTRVTIPAMLVPDSVTGTGEWMRNPIPSFASDDVACDKIMPKGEHCVWDCPGCGAPTYAADGACPCKCNEYTEYFPSGFAYVGSDPAIFPDPLPNFSHEYHSYAVEDALLVPKDIPAGDYVLGKMLLLARSAPATDNRLHALRCTAPRRFANDGSLFPCACLRACCFAHCCPQAGAGTASRRPRCGPRARTSPLNDRRVHFEKRTDLRS